MDRDSQSSEIFLAEYQSKSPIKDNNQVQQKGRKESWSQLLSSQEVRKQ
jgi:hypothetical protein